MYGIMLRCIFCSTAGRNNYQKQSHNCDQYLFNLLIITFLALRVHLSNDTAVMLMKNDDFVMECRGVRYVKVCTNFMNYDYMLSSIFSHWAFNFMMRCFCRVEAK